MSQISPWHNLPGLGKRTILFTPLEKLETDKKHNTIYALLYKEKGDWMLQVSSGSKFEHLEPWTEDSFELTGRPAIINEPKIGYSKTIDYFLGERGQVFHNLNRIVEALRLKNNGKVVQRY